MNLSVRDTGRSCLTIHCRKLQNLAAEEFDRQFPYKEKKTLPGQIFS